MARQAAKATAPDSESAELVSAAPNPDGSLRRLLVIVEGRGKSQAAVIEGLALAQAHGAGIVFVHVLPRDMPTGLRASAIAALSGEELHREVRNQSDRLLAAALASARKAGIEARATTLSALHADQRVAEAALEQGCDLIVVATDGRNAVARLISGSLIPGLITASSVPVLVCPATAAQPTPHGPRRRRHRHRPTPKPASTGPSN